MTEKLEFTTEERQQALALYDQLKNRMDASLSPDDEQLMRRQLDCAISAGLTHRDAFGLNPIVTSLQTALLAVEEIGLRRDAVMAIMLRACADQESLTVDEASRRFGPVVGRILHGLRRIEELYQNNPVAESERANFVRQQGENFRNLLLSFAEARHPHHDCRPRQHDAPDP